MDLDCGIFYPNYTEGSVRQGKVGVKDIDRSLNYLYIVLMRLGFFDGNRNFQSLGKQDICSDEHIELATDAARQGIVLLKNDNSTLPLDPKHVKTVAVVGPHANATSAMIGNYAGQNSAYNKEQICQKSYPVLEIIWVFVIFFAGVPCRLKSPLDGVAEFAKVNYQMGCENVACKNDTFIFPAMDAAKNSDATVIAVGIDLSVEAESLDRVDLLLPGYQTQLIQQVAAVSKGPVILLILSAGGIDISFAKSDPNIEAILWAGYPGEEGGRAIAELIFGKYSPGNLNFRREQSIFII